MEPINSAMPVRAWLAMSRRRPLVAWIPLLSTALLGCASAHSVPPRFLALDEGDRAAIYRVALGRYLQNERMTTQTRVVYVSLNGRSPSAAFLRSLPPSETTLEPLEKWKRGGGRLVDVDVSAVTRTVEVVASEGFHWGHRPNQSGCSCVYTIGREAPGIWRIRSEECALLD